MRHKTGHVLVFVVSGWRYRAGPMNRKVGAIVASVGLAWLAVALFLLVSGIAS